MNDAILRQEAVVFTQYLVGCVPTEYVTAQYAEAHAALPGMEPADGHERWLLAVARTAPAGCRIADAWARHAAPASALRRKLVVLLAILEVSPPFAEVLDKPTGGPAAEWAGMIGAGVVSVLALLVGAVVFLPVRLTASGRRGGT